MTKEELELDFITKFGLHSENYFGLNSQLLSVILTDRKKIEEESKSDENKDEINESYEELEENDETKIIDKKESLITEDQYPIFWDNKENTLTVNTQAGIPFGTNFTDKNKLTNENKNYILSNKNSIFKKFTIGYLKNNEYKTYSKVGYPLITYLYDKKNKKRIPLKLNVIQDKINIDLQNNNKLYIEYQSDINGKLLKVDNYSYNNLKKNGIYFTDLQKYTIFEIINNSDKLDLKTSKSSIPILIKIAEKIKENYKGGYITGTKAKYTEHVVLGTNKLSPLTDDLTSLLEIKAIEKRDENGKIIPVNLSMFNKKILK